ncbi:acyl-CoA dehydrogenase [Domibacillus aminovorans]|uniref:Dibenzothiophene monooxygenase n=1 Tax=Domibacillus aminovorans TaxID=29332 RepID=A0A177KLT0_9BACI|nr:acyl-CoA dehydrogenase [Domibacillus aminovorans]
MSNQKQLNSKVNKAHFPPLTFTEPVKVGSDELDQLIAAIARDAEKRRNAGNETRPYYAIDLIQQSGLGALRLPVELGGGGVSIRELFHFVIRLAEVDPDVAHILRFHYYQVEILLLSPASELRNIQLKRVAEGAIIGNAFTELSSNNVGNFSFETTLSPDGEGYRLNGTKYFSTGTLYADSVLVMASTPDGATVSALIPTDREGVIIEDDWEGIGQRLTGSGTTRLNNVFVNSDEVTVINEDQTPFNSHLQLYLHAVIAGILRNVVTDASDLVHRRSRTFSFAAAETPSADPQLQQIIGQLSSSSFAAEAIVLAAADALDIAVNSAVDGVIDYSLSHDASLRSAQTKVIVDNLALQASTLLFEVGGASATKQSANLDRHWRNIRTIASHNPVVYKARAIGNYVVNGTELPLKEVYF